MTALAGFLRQGTIGVIILLIITYILSSDRKRIPWKTVSLGLLAQFLIALGVLKVALLKQLFEGLGGFFINILEYTQTGTRMLLGDFVNVDQYGFIFVFQALPVIVFFSALTSVLYYFGIIQRVVKLLAWDSHDCSKYRVRKAGCGSEYFYGTDRSTTTHQRIFKTNDTLRVISGHGGRNGNSSRKCNGCLHQFFRRNDPEQQLYLLKIY